MKLSVSMTKSETFWGWIYFVFQFFGLPYILAGINLVFSLNLSNAILNSAMFITNFVFVVLIFYRFLYRSLLQALEEPFLCLKGAFLGFLFYYLGNLIVGMVSLSLVPDFVNKNDQNLLSMVEENYTLIAVCTIFLVPVAEELLYRGLVFGKLYGKNKFLAYAVSALVFSAIHVIGYIGTYTPVHLLVSFLQYIVPSLCLAWAYAYNGNIWSSILMHITVNQIGIFLGR